jgi:AAA+ superfamily predicted ATPase
MEVCRMLFYKVEAGLLTDGVEPEKSEHRERARAMQEKVEMFFIERGKTCHIAVSSITYRKRQAVLCSAVKKGVLTENTVREFLKAIDFEPAKLKITEVTLEIYCNMLQVGSRNDYVSGDYDVCDSLGVADLNRNYSRRGRLYFSETLLSEAATKKELLHRAEDLLCDSSLRLEIERIYQGSHREVAAGHPVHYLLLSDEREAHRQMLYPLLTALYQNGRIESRRYVEISFNGESYLPEGQLMDTLYESCAGGTMVVSFSEEDGKDSEYASTGTNVIIYLCDYMRKNRNKVLTVFCLPRKSETIKNVFLEQLGAVTLVPIVQETVFGERAKKYLKARAKEYNTTADRALYKTIADGKGYTAANLNLVFDEWYDKRLKSQIYTQYAEFETANKQIAARKAKGAAIEELERMIGLAEAKEVIRQALDFYKAQKIFKAKGFTTERPAMHMVFTGNPGTAKTTVARLFAQIMKDNEILSVGDLYEVGRADIVGKYVGWTAKIVKEKFQAAKGSVLFVDEAYSLVEKDGLYGDEAINTIVQEMENHRDDMVVIFAGYPDKMERFLQKNPGLRSRIAFHVPFADYSADDLYGITKLLAEKKELSLDDAVKGKLLPLFERAMKTEDFGNGRFARNIFEKAIMKQSSRLVAMDADSVTKNDVGTLIAADFEAPAAAGKEKRKIGFAG